MPSRPDLIEAQAFDRRRLLTAFVSGAPGGHEVEPANPGPAIIAGCFLAGLLLLGTAVAAYLTGSTTPDQRHDAGMFGDHRTRDG